jgi:uncharacterized protein YjiS (DUF1127 family)
MTPTIGAAERPARENRSCAMNATATHHAACTRSVPQVSIAVPKWRRVLRQLAIVVGWLAWQMERRRGRRALLELTDDQLKDIGLSRGHADVFVSRRPD